MSKRTRKHRRGIRHRLRTGLRRRETFLAAGLVESDHTPLEVDEELWNAFLYSVALHAPTVALHDLSFDGTSYWVMFTADLASCRQFTDAVAKDFGGFLRAFTGDGELTIVREPALSLSRMGAPVEPATTPAQC
ncbi:MAG: hypothetical protein JJ863_24970 [Deltaproteobacteria bacterium]|nr:hypothetical protein [Deltaproteobacteria bacterium]